jgi:subfamily B ATP-binding cassette protein MsbA
VSLRDEISIVDQNTTLFDDTVLNNIRYARPEASNEEVFNAAKESMCS